MSRQFDKHTMVDTIVRLPVSINLEKLRAEVAAIPDDEWQRNFRSKSIHGDVASIFFRGYPPALNIPGEDKDRNILSTCPYIHDIIYNQLGGHPGKCLIASLKPGGCVKPHVDRDIEYFRKSARIHIPIYSNDEVRWFGKGRFFSMKPGEVWAVNNLALHAVLNDHQTDARLHIIVDIYPENQLIDWLTTQTPETGIEDDACMARLAPC